MRIIPTALQTHLDGEVTSLTSCLKIERRDGVILRVTSHDVDITVSGDVYRADIPFEMSALESTDTLSIDNAEATLGIDDSTFTLVDIESGLYDGATFEYFLVNWEDTSLGSVNLKKGFLGDIEIIDDLQGKIQLRGLTYLLQKPIVERYSLTCRAALGSPRCGYVNLPNRVRRNRQKVKTFDWFLIPEANIVTPSLSNLSFESALSTGWTTPLAVWTRQSSGAVDGTYYVEVTTATAGQEYVLYRDEDISDLSLVDTNVDSGDYSIDFSVALSSTSPTIVNAGKVFVEQYDADGVTLKREESSLVKPEYGVWEGVGVTSVVMPGCRSIRFGLISKVISGSAGYIGFDDVEIRHFTNEASTWGGAAFRTVRIPSYQSDELLNLNNLDFEEDGEVGNTNTDISGWTQNAGDYWRVVASSGSLLPISPGAVFLMGGDDGSTTPAREYVLSQVISTPAEQPSFATQQALDAYTARKKVVDSATAENIDAGWYWAEIRAYVAKTDSTSAPKIVLTFVDDSDSDISSVDTGYITGLTVDSWTLTTKGAKVPPNTRKMRVELYAKSGTGSSAANVAFDDVRVYVTPVAYEHQLDEELGYLADTLPGTYDYTDLSMIKDGDVVVQTKPINFGYGAVSATTNNRSFTCSTISDTPERLYSGRIYWITGNNAGQTSFIRIWDNSTKLLKMYDALRNDIQVGDKFIYARGCDKTIGTCADIFGNAHNFRGEPYIPGENTVITYLTVDDA